MPEPSISPPESFVTKRLLLRKPHPEDAPLIFAAYARDPEVTRYLAFRPHRDLKESEAAVERFLEAWRTGKSYCWLIFRREDGTLLGAIAARHDQGINLGYALARSYWRQGFMSEALQAVMEWAFKHRTSSASGRCAIWKTKPRLRCSRRTAFTRKAFSESGPAIRMFRTSRGTAIATPGPALSACDFSEKSK